LNNIPQILSFQKCKEEDYIGDEKMSSALGTFRRHKLLFVVGLLVIAVVVVVVFYKPGGGEEKVASGVLSVSANSVADSFSYSGAGVNQSMDVGCNVPASMKIICQSLVHDGTITVYINDQNYATGTINDTGEVMLSSGCGCSTVCICEIKVGENTIRISSNDFSGEIEYEIYVKT